MGSSVTLAIDAAPLSNDYYWPADYDGRFVAEGLIRTLVPAWPSAGSNSLERGAAAAIDCLDGGERWRIHLDTSLSWSNGESLSAAHIVQAVARVLDHPRSQLLQLLRTAGPGDLPIQVVDDSCVDFLFMRPLAFARKLFTVPQLAPQHVAGNQVGAPVLGDYELTSASQDSIVLARHSHSRQSPERHHPDRLIFKIFPQLASAISSFNRGEIDISPTTSFGPSEIAAFSSHEGHVAKDILIFGNLDFGDHASLDPDVRRTLGLSLDRNRITQSCGDLVRPFWAQTSPWYREEAAEPGLTIPPADPSGLQVDRVRAAVRTDIEIPYADFNPNQNIVTEICRQLSEIFGITAIPRPLGYRQYVKAALSRRFVMLYTLTAAEFSHPASLLLPWRSNSPNAQRLKFADAALDSAIDRASANSDDQQRALWRSADQRWLTLMPRIPLVQVRAHCVHGNRISDVRLSSCGLVDFGQLALK